MAHVAVAPAQAAGHAIGAIGQRLALDRAHGVVFPVDEVLPQHRTHQRLFANTEDLAHGRVGLDDPAIVVEQRLADGRIAHRAAEAMLAAPVGITHLRSEGFRTRLGTRQVQGDRKQQQRTQCATEQGRPQSRDRIADFSHGLRFEVHAPVAAHDVQSQALHEGRTHRFIQLVRPTTQETGIGMDEALLAIGRIHDLQVVVPLECLQRDLDKPLRVDFDEYPATQILGPRPITARGVDRREHRELAGRIVCRRQEWRYRSANAQLTCCRGLLHRISASRMGRQIDARNAPLGTQVGCGVQDQRVACCRIREVRPRRATYHPWQRLAQGVELLRVDIQGKPERLHRWKPADHVQAGDVALPLLATGARQRGLQRCAATDQQLVVDDALLEQA